MLLPVSAPFHSTLMQPAADKLEELSGEGALRRADDPGGEQRRRRRSRASPARIKDALVRQAASPVRWVETIRKMADAGRDAHRRMRPGQGARRPDQAHRRRASSRSRPPIAPSLEQALQGVKHDSKERSRWSPAPRAASATRSPPSWRGRAPRSSAPRPREAGAQEGSRHRQGAERARRGADATRWSRRSRRSSATSRSW